ncbi:MAG: thioredoxin family protein [Rhodoferax sp.]|uniref:thioredoxin family protein n=1 Tax=Rhodoferax sp. TaxID=50421 RepID=UPI001400DBC7|nr:thioredoxin family protein [Rhodoferax sp.]NDP38210.1 thioredoxin family protein [Rhodoferax sp.]
MHTLSRVLTCFLIVLLAPLVVAQDLPAKFDPQRDAAKDMTAAQNSAKATGRRVLVDVGGEWCTWCRMLDRFVASQPQISALIDSRYVWVKVNYSPENKNTAVLSRWPKIRGYPYFLVLDGAGRLLHAQGVQGLETETEIEGDENYDPERVMAFLNRYATEADVPAQSH